MIYKLTIRAKIESIRGRNKRYNAQNSDNKVLEEICNYQFAAMEPLCNTTIKKQFFLKKKNIWIRKRTRLAIIVLSTSHVAVLLELAFWGPLQV